MLAGCASREMVFERGLDSRRAEAALEPADLALVADEHDRRHGPDPEVRRDALLLADVDDRDREAVTLLVREVGEHAFEAAARTGASR